MDCFLSILFLLSFFSSTQIVSPYDDGIPGNPVGSLQVGFLTWFFFVFLCLNCAFPNFAHCQSFVDLLFNLRPLFTDLLTFRKFGLFTI